LKPAHFKVSVSLSLFKELHFCAIVVSTILLIAYAAVPVQSNSQLLVLIPIPSMVDGNDCGVRAYLLISGGSRGSVVVIFASLTVCPVFQDSAKNHS
jgi:hypothetical protein